MKESGSRQPEMRTAGNAEVLFSDGTSICLTQAGRQSTVNQDYAQHMHIGDWHVVAMGDASPRKIPEAANASRLAVAIALDTFSRYIKEADVPDSQQPMYDIATTYHNESQRQRISGDTALTLLAYNAHDRELREWSMGPTLVFVKAVEARGIQRVSAPPISLGDRLITEENDWYPLMMNMLTDAKDAPFAVAQIQNKVRYNQKKDIAAAMQKAWQCRAESFPLSAEKKALALSSYHRITVPEQAIIGMATDGVCGIQNMSLSSVNILLTGAVKRTPTQDGLAKAAATLLLQRNQEQYTPITRRSPDDDDATIYLGLT